MQGKLTAVACTLRTYWNQFSLGGICKQECISVRLVSEEDISIEFRKFDNSHNSFLWPEYFINFLCERWIPCQASTSVLCLHYRPETVQCSTKDAYTSEITFLASHPCIYLSINPPIWHFCNSLFKINILGPWTNFLDFHIFVFPRCSRSINLYENYSSKY